MTSFYSKVDHPLTTEDIWNKTEWLSRREAATWIKMSDYWLEKHARDGKGPEFSSWGRKTYYRKRDLISWLEKMSASGKLEALYKASEVRRPAPPSPIEMEISRKRTTEAKTKKAAEAAFAKSLSQTIVALQTLQANLQNIAHA